METYNPLFLTLPAPLPSSKHYVFNLFLLCVLGELLRKVSYTHALKSQSQVVAYCCEKN